MQPQSSELLSDVYQAIDDDSALSRLAGRVATACDARSANIIYTAPRAAPFQQISYFPEAYVPLYLERFLDKDPWRKMAQELGVTDRAVAMDEYVPPTEFERTEFFNELLKPLGDDTGRCMGLDGSSAKAKLHIAVHRPLRGRPFLRSDKRDLQLIFTHVAKVLDVRIALAKERSYSRTLESMISATESLLISVDRHMGIVACSGAGLAWLEAGDGVAYRNGKLEIGSRDTAAGVARAVADTIDRRATQTNAFLAVRKSELPAYRVFVLPASSQSPNQAILLIDEPMSCGDQRKLALLAQAYGFTPAETCLCRLLLQGSSLRDISEQREVSLETVRTQLKAIFWKTGANRQVDLIALLS